MINLANLPDRFDPCKKEEEDHRTEETMFAIGYTKDAEEFAMSFGPTPNLQDMLNTIPDENHPNGRAALVAFAGKKDDWKGSQILYLWRKGEWRRIDTL